MKSKLENFQQKNEDLRNHLLQVEQERDFLVEKMNKIQGIIDDVPPDSHSSMPILQDIVDELYEQDSDSSTS